jgi:hypothetical protein
MTLRSLTLDDLMIDDEASLARVALYPRLKEAVRRSQHRFLVPGAGAALSWDRALFLNLTYWNAEGADVLCDEHIPADVVTHVAWHHLVGERLASAGGDGRSALALFFAESMASAFDLHMLGHLWQAAPASEFVTTQVPIMSEAAAEAGLSDADFADLVAEVAGDPDRAFEALRALLVDVTAALFACGDAAAAHEALKRFGGHRLYPLLHHYQLSNWILYARAYGHTAPATDQIVRTWDATLREAPVSLRWLAENWLI